MEEKKIKEEAIEDKEIVEEPVEIIEPVKIVEPAEEIKAEKKMISFLYIIFALILIFIIAAIVFFLLNDMNKQNSNNDNNKPAQKVEDDLDINAIEIASWNGTYVNENNTVIIYKTSKNSAIVNIVAGNKVAHLEPTVTSLTEIEYEEDIFGDESLIYIKKTTDGIKINSYSNEEDSILNSMGGTYTKKQFESAGWDGTYSNDSGEVILSEVNDNYIACTIKIGYSSVMFSFSEINENELKYNDSTDNESLTITKTDKGIEIVSTSIDKDSLFNELSGIYLK